MPSSVGTYVVYALTTPNQPAPGHIHYAQIMRIDTTNNIHIVTLCVSVNLPMLLVPWPGNPVQRFSILPNHLVQTARLAIQAPLGSQVMEALGISMAATAAMWAASAPSIVLAAAAPGLWGGAALMNGLAAVGGTAMGGIAVISVAPAAVGAETINRLVNAIDNDDETKKATKIATRTTSAVAASASVAAVPIVGGSLSAAGITSGLAGVGSVVGGGMAAGIIVCAVAPLLAVGAVGGTIMWVTTCIRQRTLKREYNAFLNRWNGYGGPP
ncbi:hypothetical protein B0H19DRAFT_1263359 [Mycena capillaripes]|nr:hypothetical protein B0H19DRAFT_1263359 [Mycena capillaripes]